MKLHLLHKNLDSNIQVSLHEEKEFLKLWHYHPELELVYIAKGKGTLFAGDFIGDYREHDIYFLGKNVPHMFYSKSAEESESISKAYVIHVNEAFLNQFQDQSEFSYFSDLLKISKRGVMFRTRENFSLLQKFDEMLNMPLHETALNTLQVLYSLSNNSAPENLGSINWLKHYRVTEKRLNKVIEHIMLNFKAEISLDQAAEIAGMSKAAFCRYFKDKTGRTFVSFLNEIRINFSCKLLMEVDPIKSISEACYQSGFNSLSYYNRTFKRITGLSPKGFRKKNIL